MHLTWEERYDVGIDEVDRQHRELIAIYNRLVDACTENEKPLHAAAAINEFISKVKAHTVAEENLLFACRCAGAEAHLSDHLKFMHELEDLERRFLSGGSPNRKLGTIQMMGRKLVDHIRSDDRCDLQYTKSQAYPEEQARI